MHRSWPRSNPCTQTSMRRESLLLETGRADNDVSTNDVVVGTVNDGMLVGNNNEASTTSRHVVVDGDANPVESGNEAMDRNIFNTRCHQAGSMPGEDEEVVVESRLTGRSHSPRSLTNVSSQLP